VEERDAFVAHPVLGGNYGRIVAAVWEQMQRGISAHELFGSPDDLKLVSSLTLFASVPHAGEILDAIGTRCAATEAFLRDARTA
jgi:uncharacterized protein (DUF1810 family)